MRPLSFLALPVLLIALAGCESDRPQAKVQTTGDQAVGSSPVADERAAIERDIAALANGRDPSDAKAAKLYQDAVDALIRRRSEIETTLIDNLRRSEDGNIRRGLVEVLMSTGTRASVPHLIAVLDDPVPLVALRANTTLQEMTQHAEIPTEGAAGANGLPPVPKPPADDLQLDAELRQWTAWHTRYRGELKQAWAAWWSANKDQITIK